MNAEGAVYVLDSFAVLAYLGDESGRARVQEVLEMAEKGECRAVLSLINVGEIAYIIERAQGLQKAQEALGLLQQLPVTVLPASQDMVLSAAHIKANYPLAYADAFAVAAALTERGTILTGDPEFKQVADLVKVEMIAGV